MALYDISVFRCSQRNAFYLEGVLSESMDRSSTLNVGSPAPEFELPQENEEPLSLRKLLQSGPVVLLYIPSAWGFVCSVEMTTFRNKHDEFVSAGGRLVVVNTQSSRTNAVWGEHLHLPFHILSDFDGKVSERYGILLGEESYYPNASNRSIFIVSKEGRITYIWVAEDPSMEPNYDEALQKLRDTAEGKL
jgi:peroxiredoxin